MTTWTFVVHVHTRHSLDGWPSPLALARHAEALGIDVLAVTDHDTWQGAVETRAAARELGLRVTVVLGSEVHTDRGDVIGLFLRSDVRERDAVRFCDAVHAEGGIVLLPHPFKAHRLDDALLERIDLVEVHNGRLSPADNARALELARTRGLPELVGPDAHRLGELDLATVRFEGPRPVDEDGIRTALLSAPRTFQLRAGSPWDEWRSQALKLTRRPRVRDAWWLARGAVRRLLKPAEYRR
jgi:hypothetical protein